MRKIFCDELINAFKKKPFVFLTGDLGYKALEPLQEVMGSHFINAGIAEQNMVSTAAGIAKTGLEVFVYSIAPFVYARPFEQIRNDIALHNLPVTLVGNGGGYGYGVMGATHHAIEDYGALLTLQNMQIFIPVFKQDISTIIAKIREIKKPSYLRLGMVENNDESLAYSPFRNVLKGDLGVLIIVGSIAGNLLKDLQIQPKSNRPSLWILSELPILNNLPDEISGAKKLCVLEEHVAHGSAGQVIATKLLENNIAPKSFLHLHAKGYVSGLYGSQNFHRQESGLNIKNILDFFRN